MSHIVAFSGKKQSGKNTAVNFVVGINLLALGIVRDTMTIQPDGRIWITDIFGEPAEGVFDLNNPDPKMLMFLEEHVYPYVKIYSFADLLKRNVCMGILGLTHEQCYGTDEQKNSLTHLDWQNMPNNSNRDGYMTAREVMQHIGTDVFRKMYGNVWAEATIRQIQLEDPEVALICDCRFPNEVESVQNAGGKVVRLTRFIDDGNDTHDSETLLDKDKFDHNKFDFILDNANMTISEQNKAIYEILVPWNSIPQIKEDASL